MSSLIVADAVTAGAPHDHHPTPTAQTLLLLPACVRQDEAASSTLCRSSSMRKRKWRAALSSDVSSASAVCSHSASSHSLA